MNLQHFARAQRRLSGLAYAGRPPAPLANAHKKLRVARKLLNEGHLDRAFALAGAIAPLAPLDPDVLQLRGDCLVLQGEPARGIALYDKALTFSDTAELWAAKGRALMAMQRPRRAASCFERAVAQTPKGKHAHAMAEALLQSGAPKDALKALSHQPNPCNALKAAALAQLGQYQTAFEMASTDPTNLRHLSELAQTPTQMQSLAQRARRLAHATDAPLETLCDVAAIVPEALDPSAIERLKASAAATSARSVEKSKAHLALFHILDACGTPEDAALHLIAHHRCCEALSNYDSSQNHAQFAFLSGLKFTPLPPTKSLILPIFVTGLPGSGVSEAAHTLRQGTQHRPPRTLTIVEATMTRLMRVLQAEGRSDVTREDLLSVQSDLREGLSQAAAGADVVIDCTRMNFRWSGLIAAALPEARIIHMSRDPIQTGWTTYRSNTCDPALSGRHNLTNLAEFLLHSKALMQHWERNHPSVLGISGDALCRPGGATARALLKSCGLNWSVQCSIPNYTPNRDWHRYATTIAPLRAALKSFTPSQAVNLPM